jgi:hypothetical protein
MSPTVPWARTGSCAARRWASPTLAAGLTLTHTCARHCAYTILELERGEHDAAWLRQQYDELQRKRVVQHMRFAEYWYSANGCFSVIHDHCADIAKEAGLKLDPAAAFRWLSNGGLDDEPGQANLGGFNVAGIKQVQWRLAGGNATVEYAVNGKNVFKLNLANAEETSVAFLEGGRIRRAPAWKRGGRTLTYAGLFTFLIDVLREHSDLDDILKHLQRGIARHASAIDAPLLLPEFVNLLETMVTDYWVMCGVRKDKPVLDAHSPKEGKLIYTSRAPGNAPGEAAPATDATPAPPARRPTPKKRPSKSRR